METKVVKTITLTLNEEEMKFLKKIISYYAYGLKQKIELLKPKEKELSSEKYTELQDAYYESNALTELLSEPKDIEF